MSNPFILAILGVGGYEALRVYHRLMAGESPIPLNKSLGTTVSYICYLIVMAIIGAFAGVIALTADLPGKFWPLYIGFSIFSSAEGILTKLKSASHKDVPADDTEIEEVGVKSFMLQEVLSFVIRAISK